MAARLNHVSIQARDIEPLAAFYTDLFDGERIPSVFFGITVAWIRLSDGLQLHVFPTDQPVYGNHHLGVEVDDVPRVVRRIDELGLWEEEGFFSRVYELPDGALQIYLRDPEGNLVEIDHPRAADFDPAVFGGRLHRTADLFPQTEVNAGATLFTTARAAAVQGGTR